MYLKSRIEKLEEVAGFKKVPVIVGSSEEEIEEQKRKLTEEGIDFSGAVVLVAEPHNKGIGVEL